MGSIFKLSTLNKDKLNKLLTPIIFCHKEERIKHLLVEYDSVSLNEVLSARLLNIDADKRNLLVTDVLNNIINNLGKVLIIKDFEILFDPEYQIDVIKYFTLINRNKKVIVIWNGKYKDGKLTYAEPEYIDYKSYNIKDYDISCII